ncbi:hypothetical protein ACFL96_08820, partial [Thermoproteota archaeon]
MKRHPLTIILVIALFLISISSVMAATLTVCGAGCNSTTIQGAIDIAGSGDTVEVADGTYDERLVIGTRITLDCNSSSTIIQPSVAPTPGVYDVEIDASNTIIRDCVFDFNDADNTRSGNGIVVSDLNDPAVTGVQISGNTIYTGDANTGIQTGKYSDVSDLYITSNTFHGDASGSGEGVYVNPHNDSGVVTINGNEFYGYIYSAISIEASQVTVSSNTINSNGTQGVYGVRVIDLTGGESYNTILISGNNIQNVQYGVSVGTSSDLGSSLDTTISSSTFSNNDYDIRHRYGADLGLSGNTAPLDWLVTGDVQAAIDSAVSGDTLYIASGTYDERLVIGTAITLDCLSGAIIQPSVAPTPGVYDVEIDASNTVIQNCTFDFNDAGDTRSGNGIVVSDLNDPAVTGVQILGNTLYTGDANTGIQTGKYSDVSGLVVRDNTFHGDATGSGEGVYINPHNDSGAVTVANNYFYGYIFSGVSIEASQVTAANNTINSNGTTGVYGVRVIDLTGGVSFDDILIDNNNIQNVNNGIRIGTSTDVGSTLTVTVEDNTITGTDEGFDIRYGADPTTLHNQIYSNTVGADNSGSGSVTLEQNWWGHSSGPAGTGPGSGDSVSANIDYDPWCADAGCTASEDDGSPEGFPGDGSTNFSDVSDYSSVNLSLDDGVDVIINFANPLDLSSSNLEFDIHVRTAQGYVSIDANNMPELDAPATITFYGLGFAEAPILYRDGVVCPPTICSVVSYSGGTLVFTVTSFSTYYVESALSAWVNRLNYWDAENHTVSMNWGGTGDMNISATLPSGWSFVSGSGCTNPTANIITCNNIAPDSPVSFVMTVDNASAHAEFDMSTIEIDGTADNVTYYSPDIRLIRIQEGRIFHTLVEYGRGRGNYMYDSFGGTAGSGKTGTGCPYVPNGTRFELNFLHKVLNIGQYFELAGDDAPAMNASFTCTYSPPVASVRNHQTTSIFKDADYWILSYFMPEIGSSWERMGYFALDYDETDLDVGDLITVNCTGLGYNLTLTETADGSYVISGAYGDVIVNQDLFTLTTVDKAPFTVSAVSSYAYGYQGLYPDQTTGTNEVGNGTQELLIRYTITNTGVTMDDIVIEIEAPEYATFIGTRGELWGSSLDKYRYELLDIPAGGSEVIDLIVRFDTSGAASSLSSIELSEGVKIRYTPCWEANAYNPTEYIQDMDVTENVSVNMSKSVAIISIQHRIDDIFDIVQVIEGLMNRAVFIEDVGQDCAVPGEGLNFAWTFRDILGEDVATADISLNASADCTFYYVDPSGTNDAVAGITFNTAIQDGLVEVKWTNTLSRESVLGTYEIICNSTLNVADAPHADSDAYTYPENGSLTTNITTLKAHGMLQTSCGVGSGGGDTFNVVINNDSFSFYNDSNTNGQVSNCDDWYSGLKFHAEVQNLNNFTTTPTLTFVFPWPVDNTDLVSEPATGSVKYQFRSNDVVAEWTGTLASGQVLDLNWTWNNVYCEYFNDIVEEINYTRQAIYECNITVWRHLSELEKNELRKELEKLDDIWDDLQVERDSWYDTTITTSAQQSAQSVTAYFEAIREMWYWEWDRRVIDTYIKCQLLRDIYEGGKEIIEKLERLEDFNEEMVFLITDSIVMEREAQQALVKGDRDAATDKLMQASNRLQQVSNMINERESGIRDGTGSMVLDITSWWLPVLIIIMIMVLAFYLFSRPNEPYEEI